MSLSAAGLVEAPIVVEDRQGPDATRDLGLLPRTGDADTIPVDRDQAVTALAAWRRFGKGRLPAALDLGDTFSYARATVREEPLLYEGGDFSRTDVASVL